MQRISSGVAWRFFGSVALVWAAAESLAQPPTDDLSGLRVSRNIAYHAQDGVSPRLLSLDVYAPAKAQQLPVVVFIHGGGWRQGDKAQAVDKGRFFAERGALLVSVNYRLSPRVQHPTHIEDVIRALAWVKAEIAAYGGDPHRIAVMGHSAGAHLAALAGVDTSRLQMAGLTPRDLKAVVCLDGAGYDIAWQVEELGSGRAGVLYRNAFGNRKEDWNDASPVVQAETAKHVPCYLLLHVGGREDSRRQSERLADAVRAAGGKAAVVAAPGKTHATINREIGRPNDPVTAIVLRVLEAVWTEQEPLTVENLRYGEAVPSVVPSEVGS